MDTTKIKLLKYYLSTLEYPPSISSDQEKYLAIQSKYYGLKNDILYRKGTKVLDKF